MVTWVILGVYAAGYVLAARKIAVAMLGQDDPDDGEGRVMSRAVACIAALAWPLILLGALVTGRLPKTDREIRALLEARDARIAELEAELGVGR